MENDQEIIDSYKRISAALQKTRAARLDLDVYLKIINGKKMTPEQIKKGFELYQAIQNVDIALTEGTFVRFELKTAVLKSDHEVIKLCEDARKELADKIKEILIDKKKKMEQQLTEV